MIKFTEEDFDDIQTVICYKIADKDCGNCHECVKNYLEQHLEYLESKNVSNNI